jgi:hypothetical protein
MLNRPDVLRWLDRDPVLALEDPLLFFERDVFFRRAREAEDDFFLTTRRSVRGDYSTNHMPSHATICLCWLKNLSICFEEVTSFRM